MFVIMGDWVFIVLLWALLVGGLVLLAWALLWDRSRGRRRCPKCWYGMEGVPPGEGGGWRCPECGREIEDERKLVGTRRRWRHALLAVVLLLGSYASFAGPVVRDRGWWGLAPDSVLIALLPSADAFDRQGPQGGTTNAFLAEVGARSEVQPGGATPTTIDPHWLDGELWGWERWLLRRQARALLAAAESDGYVSKAVWLSVIASDRLDAGLPADHLADAIVARSKLAYARCEAYMDYGIHVDLPGVGPHPYELFVTAMERPGRFRYEGRDRHPFAHSDWMRRAVWRGDDGVLRSWWSVRDDEGVATPSRLGLALASVHHDVAGALLPAEHWGSPLSRTDVSEFAGEVDLLGHKVYQLRGQNRYGGLDMLWIDAETFAVRRAKNIFGDTWFVPSIGDSAASVLDASWWSFDPARQDDTPLERFDARLQALLGEIEMPSPEEQGEAGRLMEERRLQRRRTP